MKSLFYRYAAKFSTVWVYYLLGLITRVYRLEGRENAPDLLILRFPLEGMKFRTTARLCADATFGLCDDYEMDAIDTIE